MYTDTYGLLKGFIEYIWYFFNRLVFPGTNITMAEIGFFSLFVPLIIKLIQRALSGVSSIHVNEKVKNHEE